MTVVTKPNAAWRGDPTFLPALLKHFGIPYKELPGWLTWGMGDFGAIQGVMWHHTGAANTSAAYIARNTGLGGALSSQFHTAPDGLHTLCGVGIAYHAGAGQLTGWRTNLANWDAIGFEIQGNGTDQWPAKQIESVQRATAVILWFLGKRATKTTMISHWEYSLKIQGKWDPGAGNGRAGSLMDMDFQRKKVNELIDNINKYGALDAPTTTTRGDSMLFKQITDFIKGYLSPQIDALQEVWRQLRGPGGAGWPQLGQNSKGQNLSLVDAIAAVRHDLAALSSKIENLEKEK